MARYCDVAFWTPDEAPVKQELAKSEMQKKNFSVTCVQPDNFYVTGGEIKEELPNQSKSLQERWRPTKRVQYYTLTADSWIEAPELM